MQSQKAADGWLTRKWLIIEEELTPLMASSSLMQREGLKKKEHDFFIFLYMLEDKQPMYFILHVKTSVPIFTARTTEQENNWDTEPINF